MRVRDQFQRVNRMSDDSEENGLEIQLEKNESAGRAIVEQVLANDSDLMDLFSSGVLIEVLTSFYDRGRGSRLFR